MKSPKTNLQNGIALVSALLILILLSAIAVGLVLTSNTETAVNANYRQERALDFAARAGIEGPDFQNDFRCRDCGKDCG